MDAKNQALILMSLGSKVFSAREEIHKYKKLKKTRKNL